VVTIKKRVERMAIAVISSTSVNPRRTAFSTIPSGSVCS